MPHHPVSEKSHRRFERLRSNSLGWGLLIAVSLAMTWVINALGLSAAWMLGPMLAAIILACRGWSLTVNRTSYDVSQAVIGCLIAQSLSMSIIREVAKDWPIFLLVIVLVMVLSWGLGWGLAKLKVMPAEVAIWGASPGAASAMVILAKAYGADARLVALMQYLRVLLVVVMASIVASIVVPGHHQQPSLFQGWTAIPSLRAMMETIGLIGVSLCLARVTKISAGAMLIPMILGTILNIYGVITIELPAPLLAISYLVIGWVIGLGFDSRIIRTSIHALPRIILMNVLLLVLCAGLGYLTSIWFHIDGLSAYLATNPGGANTVAIIAVSNPVNVPFIMALQTSRMLMVIAFGPWIAKRIGASTTRLAKKA